MKSILKRFGTGLLALLILISALPISISAAPSSSIITTPATGYTKASDVKYVTANVDGKTIIANWGARAEDCVFLSTYAQNYYKGEYSFDTLSDLSGGTSQSNAPSSALYRELQDLMASTHSFYTYYGGNQNVRKYYKYTDCVSSDTSKVALLYRGGLVSSTWDSGKTWNQEHMWPKSKLSTDKQIGDIMQLRPANPSENTSRNNTAYGVSGSYYNPGPSVRGDCARLVLYMYVRWGTTSTMWGTGGVIENVDVLLDWMEEDPVDTWEMGRNDAVQSVTGTRNVFVDYPEFAWLLFGEDVPDNYTTPSGNGGSVTPGCNHVWIAATCTAPKTCASCGATDGEAAGHKDTNNDNICDVCIVVLGCLHNWVAKYNTVNHYEECSLCKETRNQVVHTLVNNQCACGYVKEQSQSGSYEKVDLSQGTISEGIYVIGGLSGTAANGETYAFMNGTDDGSNRLKADILTLNGTTVTTTDENLLWNFIASGDGFKIQNVKTGMYLYFGSKTGNKIFLTNDVNTAGVWKIVSNANGWTLQEEASGRQLSANAFGSGTKYLGFAAYASSSSTKRSIDLYAQAHTHSYQTVVTAPTCVAAGYTTYTCSCGDTYTGNEVAALGHTNADAVVENENAATCVAAGSYDSVVYCSVCKAEISRKTFTTEATGEHTYVDGTCTGCGAAEEVAPTIDETLTIVGKDMLLGGYIGAQFTVNPEATGNYDSVYIVVVFDGLEYTYEVPLYEGAHVFEHRVAPKYMGEALQITAYGVKNGVIYYGETEFWSIKDGIMERLAKFYPYIKYEQYKNRCILLVDMLYYGAAAQSRFGTDDNGLVTDGLDEGYAALKTATEPTIEKVNTATKTSSNQLYQVNLGVEDAVQMQFTFRLKVEDYSQYLVKITANGTTYEYTGESFIPQGDTSTLKKFVTVVFDKLEAVNMRDEITVELWQNGAKVSDTYTMSIEGFATASIAAGNNVNLLKAMITYGDSAKVSLG